MMDATQPMVPYPAKRPAELAEPSKLAKLTNSSTPTTPTTLTTPTAPSTPTTPTAPSTPTTPTTFTTPTAPSTPTTPSKSSTSTPSTPTAPSTPTTPSKSSTSTPSTPTSENSLPDTVDFDLTDDNPDDDKKVLYAFYLDLGNWSVESLFVSTRRQYKHALGHNVGISQVTHPWCEVDVWLKPDHFDEIAVIQDISTDSALHNLLHYLPIGYDVVGGFIDNLADQNSTYCACKRCVEYFGRKHD